MATGGASAAYVCLLFMGFAPRFETLFVCALGGSFICGCAAMIKMWSDTRSMSVEIFSAMRTRGILKDDEI